MWTDRALYDSRVYYHMSKWCKVLFVFITQMQKKKDKYAGLTS